VHLFILFFIFGQFLNDTALYESFGFFDSKPTIVGLILFSIVYSPIEHTIGFFMNMLSRAFEFEADAVRQQRSYCVLLLFVYVVCQEPRAGY